MAATRYCAHGLIERDKLGVDTDDDGIETCRGCGLPTWDSVAVARSGGARVRATSAKPIPLMTLPGVPGRTITAVLGVVSGVGHPSAPVLTSTATRGAAAHAEALEDLSRAARRMGADAVVGLTLGVYTGGNRSMNQAIGVHLLGTAVRLVPVDSDAS